MSNLRELQQQSQTLQSNLISTLGQLLLLEEQKHVIREELSKVQGKIEILQETPEP